MEVIDLSTEMAQVPGKQDEIAIERNKRWCDIMALI